MKNLFTLFRIFGKICLSQPNLSAPTHTHTHTHTHTSRTTHTHTKHTHTHTHTPHTHTHILSHTHTQHTHIHTHITHHTHTHTHTHTHQQHCTCLRWNIFIVSYPVFLLSYKTPVSSSRKFPHKVIKVVSLQQHDVLYGFMYAIYWCFIVCYIFYTKPYTEVWIHLPREKIH